jgi:outer membrane protein assembly factor BamE (lipoprotein component of BamABCDE complex)
MNRNHPYFTISGQSNPVFRSTPPKMALSASVAAVLAAGLIAGLGGCVPNVDQRGNLPEPDKLALIQPGKTTREEVAKILGTPSSIAIFDDKNWYYISRKTKQVAFLDPDVLDQQVFIVNFDAKGVVRGIDHKGLQDGREIEPARGATPAPGRELTFLEQVLGNIGRFNRSPKGTGETEGSKPGPRPNDPER